MQMWTGQLSNWRQIQASGIEVIDTTVKGGKTPFAPTWDIVHAHKSYEITDEEYRARYIELMRESWREHRDEWLHFIMKPNYALCCFCRPGNFCHRHILREMFEKVAAKQDIPLVYRGEILKK